MAQKIIELEEQFQQFEQSIGINDQNFANKFIFQQLRENLIKASTESNDKLQKFLDQAHTNLYLEISSKIQADLDGFTREEQNLLQFYGASIISDACQYLQLPITTCVSAQTIFHRFYTKCSFLKHDLRDVAMGSVFIAGKAQETIKKPRDLAYVFDQIFKIEDGMQRPVPLLDDKSFKFNHLKQVVQDMEREILKELGFEIYQITWNEQPHRLMYFYINLFKPNPSNQSSSFQNLTRTAFNYLNDSYKTNICIFFPFQMVVASCIYLAFRKTGTEMPRIAWWTIMETSLSNLKLGAGKIQYIYNQFKQLPKYEDCFEILNKLAKQKEIELKITLKHHEFTDRFNQSSASQNPMLSVHEAIAKSKLKGQNGLAPGASSSDMLLSSDQLEKKENQEESTGVTSLRDVTSSKNDKHSKFSTVGRSTSRDRDRRKRSRSNSHKKSHKRRSSRSRSHNRNRDRKDKDKKHSSRHSRSRDRRDRSNSHKDKKKRSRSRERERERERRKEKQDVQKPSSSEQQQNDQQKSQEEQKANGNGALSSIKTTSETPDIKQDKPSPSNSKKEKNQRDRESASTVRDVREGREREKEKDKDRKERKKSRSRSRSHHKKSKKYYNSPDDRDSKRKRSKDRKKDHKKSRSNSKERQSKFSVPVQSTQQSESNVKITPSPPLKQDKFTSVINEKSNDFSSVQNKIIPSDNKNIISENQVNGNPSIESTLKTIQKFDQTKPQEQNTSLDGKKTLDIILQIKSKIQAKVTNEDSSTQKISNVTQEATLKQKTQANPVKPTLDLSAKLSEKFKQYDNKLPSSSSSSITASQPQLSKQLSKESINSNDDENNDNDDYLMRLKMLREQNKQKAQQGNQ
ncbi:hypothetical protein ABPG72_010024 [Tetrahymena utriculariae]